MTPENSPRPRAAQPREGADPGRRRPQRAQLALIVGAVVAVAMFSLGGLASALSIHTAGNASVATGTAASNGGPVTSGGSAVTVGLLYPTQTGDAVVTVDNPGSSPVEVTSVAPGGPVTASGGTGTCATTGVTLTPSDPGTIIAANDSATVTLRGVVAMAASADNGCQGATFTIPVSVTVESGA